MKVVSFNVNSIRARLHQVTAVIEAHSPAVIGVQETKVADGEFPLEEIQQLGYDAAYYGQKGHYGVALLHRVPLSECLYGLPNEPEDSQKRFIAGTFDVADQRIRICNGYFPQGENRAHPEKFPNKRRFYRNLVAYLEDNHTPSDPLLVMGDMNVAPLEQDIGIGEDNKKRWLRTGKCCFLPEEREWLRQVTDWGLTDTFPAINRALPEDALPKEKYSWFDYRSKGFEQDPKRGLRIDLILATRSVLTNVESAGIDYTIRSMEKPSDHAPVWLDIKPV